MGIYIPNMEIPKSCGKCPFNVNSLKCSRTSSGIDRDFEFQARNSDCPLLEVPVPHGRLIDAHEVRTRMIGLSFSVQTWISEVELSNVPTVIEREEE